MSPAVRPSQLQSVINVTPLVDVVLVLLIIFMILAPQMQADAVVQLPQTERPPEKPEDGKQIMVVLDASGGLWVETTRVSAADFPRQLQAAAAGREDHQVVIKADAHLTFGEVQAAMFAVENAGFTDVGLITERRDAARRAGAATGGREG